MGGGGGAREHCHSCILASGGAAEGVAGGDNDAAAERGGMDNDAGLGGGAVHGCSAEEDTGNRLAAHGIRGVVQQADALSELGGVAADGGAYGRGAEAHEQLP